MRVGVIAENPIERIGIALGLAPVPLADSWITFLLARAIMAGVRLGVFEALADGPETVEAIAKQIGGRPEATGKLLNALVGARYLRFERGRYALRPIARRWLLAKSPGSVRDKVLFQFLEWDWIQHAEDYVKTGEPLELHQRMTEEQWGTYQRGMRSGIEPMAKEVAGRLRLPRGATRMLDIGGSHGYYSCAFCRRHAGLSSAILDLPEAIRHAAPVLAKEGLGDRVVHRAGNALTDDLGDGEWDLIWIAALVHHFDADQNRALMRRCARALKPGGVVAVYEAFRLDPARGVGQIGGLMDLFFGITSRSGTWSTDEVAAWQRDAGLKPRAPMRLRLVRDLGVQAAERS